MPGSQSCLPVCHNPWEQRQHYKRYTYKVFIRFYTKHHLTFIHSRRHIQVSLREKDVCNIIYSHSFISVSHLPSPVLWQRHRGIHMHINHKFMYLHISVFEKKCKSYNLTKLMESITFSQSGDPSSMILPVACDSTSLNAPSVIWPLWLLSCTWNWSCWILYKHNSCLYDFYVGR